MLISSLVGMLKGIGGSGCHENAHGNMVHRANFRTDDIDDRYCVDFADDFDKGGWLQFDTDQDASYYGVWVSPKQLLTLTFAEGDWCLVVCKDTECYFAEIRDLIEFHKPGMIGKTISMDGRVREYYQDRSVFLTLDGKPSAIGDILKSALS